MTGVAVTVEEVNDFFAASVPFCSEMNISCEAVAPDIGVARFSYDDRWTRPGSSEREIRPA